MKVTCKVIQDLLPLYVDGVCSPDTAALVEEHLKDCAPCQEAYHALKEAPSPTPEDGADKDAAVAKGLRKVKTGLRRKRILIGVFATLGGLLVSFGLGLFVTCYFFYVPVEDTVKGVSVVDGQLTVDLERPFLLAPMTQLIPTTTSGAYQEGDPIDEPVLLIISSNTIYDSINAWFHGGTGSKTWEMTYPLTQEAWEDMHGDEQAEAIERLQDGDAPYPRTSWVPSYADDLPWGDIEKVYYYESRDFGWESQEAAHAMLDQYGTLLWTAEDGVVYQP